jgi:hypothetical protein
LHQNSSKKHYLKAQKPSKNSINPSHSAQVLAAVVQQELASRPSYLLPSVSYNNLSHKHYPNSLKDLNLDDQKSLNREIQQDIMRNKSKTKVLNVASLNKLQKYNINDRSQKFLAQASGRKPANSLETKSRNDVSLPSIHNSLNSPLLASPTPKEKHANLMQRIELIRKDRSPNVGGY